MIAHEIYSPSDNADLDLQVWPRSGMNGVDMFSHYKMICTFDLVFSHGKSYGFVNICVILFHIHMIDEKVIEWTRTIPSFRQC